MTELKLKKLVNATAFFGLMFLAVALILDYFNLLGSISSLLTAVANMVAYVVIAINAFFYAKTKRNIAYMLSYVVAVVLLVIFVILPFVAG